MIDDIYDIGFVLQFENPLFAKLKNNTHVKKITFKLFHIRFTNDDIDSQISVVLFVIVVIIIIKIVIVRLVD